MDLTSWNILLSIILAVGIWSLIPSRAFRELRRLSIKSKRPEILKTWGKYKSTQQFVTTSSILMNFRSTSAFDEEDMSTLNAIFAKLDQPPAEFIAPDRFALMPGSEEAEIQNVSGDGQIEYVDSVVQSGVKWEKQVLRKAMIKGCSADFVALSKASDFSPAIRGLSKELGDKLTETIRLDPCDIEDYLNTMGLRDVADGLFEALEKSHPSQDFYLAPVEPGEPYDQRRMRLNGNTPAGQNRVVSEITHKELLRRSDPNWRIPAFVKIQNLDTNE